MDASGSTWGIEVGKGIVWPMAEGEREGGAGVEAFLPGCKTFLPWTIAQGVSWCARPPPSLVKPEVDVFGWSGVPGLLPLVPGPMLTFDGRERPDSSLCFCTDELVNDPITVELGSGFQEFMMNPVSSSLSSWYRADVWSGLIYPSVDVRIGTFAV